MAGSDQDDRFEDAEALRPRKRPRPEEDDVADEDRRRRRPAREDDEDDRPRRRRSPRDEDEDDRDRPRPRAGRNSMATLGYYMGFLAVIFSLGGFALLVILGFYGGALLVEHPWVSVLIVFGMILGLGGICSILGIIFSSIALSRVKYYPDRPGTGHAVTGLVLSVLTLFGLIVLICAALLGWSTWAGAGRRGRF